METGVLERIRAFEADIEKSIESIVQQKVFRADIANDRHRILLDHFQLQQLEVIQNLSEKLLDAYLDEDEIVEAQKAPSDGADVLAGAIKRFEGRVADTREYHHTYRDLPSVRNQLSLPDPNLLDKLFAVNERYGACLDLETHYNRYSAFMVASGTLVSSLSSAAANHPTLFSSSKFADAASLWASTWGSRLEYFRFVPELPTLMTSGQDATRKLAAFGHYREFVEALQRYLVDFHRRTHPLDTEAVPRLLAEAESATEAFWTALTKEKETLTVVAELTGRKGRETGLDSEGGDAVVEDAEDHASSRGPVLPHGAKVSCGVVVMPSLKKYIKSCSMWPLSTVELCVSLRQALQDDAEKNGGLASPTAAAGDGGAEARRRVADAAVLASQLPASVEEVKAVSMTEGKVLALLQSLLFDVLKQTEQTLLRNYSKTVEELDQDKAQAEEEFWQSLEQARGRSAKSLEATTLSYATASQPILGPSSGVSAAASVSARPPLPVAAPGKPARDSKAAEPVPAEELLIDDKFVGEDGRPVPRWLVQLQQLEKTFVCEVCGGTVYQGPKVFREHFGQERHTEGLRRLGITQNLREYAGISSIRSAIEMRGRLGNVSGGFRRRLREDKELEEIQDGQGNVLTNEQYVSLQQRRRV